jgi:hypothetical protein
MVAELKISHRSHYLTNFRFMGQHRITSTVRVIAERKAVEHTMAQAISGIAKAIVENGIYILSEKTRLYTDTVQLACL